MWTGERKLQSHQTDGGCTISLKPRHMHQGGQRKLQDKLWFEKQQRYIWSDNNSSVHMSLIYGGEHFPFDQRRFGLKKVGEWLAPQWPPKMPPHSMPKTSEYIHFYGKRDFAGVIMLKVLSWGLLEWGPGNSIIKRGA